MGKGRKIPMEKRDTPEKLNVTFSKRRMGLFHKASELSTLCDAQVALLVSAPATAKSTKIYSFTSTSTVDPILDAFLSGNIPERLEDEVKQRAHRLSEEIEGLEATLQRVRKLKIDIKRSCPWEALDKYLESTTTVQELQTLHDCLSKLKAKYDPTFCGLDQNFGGQVGSSSISWEEVGMEYGSSISCSSNHGGEWFWYESQSSSEFLPPRN